MGTAVIIVVIVALLLLGSWLVLRRRQGEGDPSADPQGHRTYTGSG
jgi:hypothetical protein